MFLGLSNQPVMKMTSMFSQGLVDKNRLYFQNSGPNWSKLGSVLDKHILHVIDLIFG